MANGTLGVSQLEMLTQSGTGTITIVPPATNTNRTLTLPDESGTIVTTANLPAANPIDSWPVGSVFISVVATNPNTLLGGGTWVAFGAGRVLVGIDAGQTEFDTVEEVGGAKTHTLTTAEMPSHAHGITGGTIDWNQAGATAVQARLGAAVSIATGAAGSNGAHNNLQPYIVCHFWKRTA